MYRQLDPNEQALLESLPAPSSSCALRYNEVCIVEWLGINERKTGKELHDWISQFRPGWSRHFPCASAEEFFAALTQILKIAQEGRIPIIHIESHGSEHGISSGASEFGGFISWEQMNQLLQEINKATGFNLMIVASMCVGFWSMKIFASGPVSPSACFVGPDEIATPRELLEGSKELYRGLMNPEAGLAEVLNNASREVEGFEYQCEPACIFEFETFCEELIYRSRSIDVFELAGGMQSLWDQMFGIDSHPENESRFGANFYELSGIISEFRRQQPSSTS